MSVGHVARALETAGIATVIVAVEAFRNRMQMMSLPRVLLTGQPIGRPLGRPGDRQGQTAVLEAALAMLEDSRPPGKIESFQPEAANYVTGSGPNVSVS